jgi:hypothetical protein
LASRLALPALQPLKQRIGLRHTLAPLTQDETAAYIAGRIKLAGGEPSRLFSREAVAAVYMVSRGLPRTISVVCDNALLSAFAVGRERVDRQTVEAVAADFELTRAVQRRAVRGSHERPSVPSPIVEASLAQCGRTPPLAHRSEGAMSYVTEALRRAQYGGERKALDPQDHPWTRELRPTPIDEDVETRVRNRQRSPSTSRRRRRIQAPVLRTDGGARRCRPSWPARVSARSSRIPRARRQLAALIERVFLPVSAAVRSCCGRAVWQHGQLSAYYCSARRTALRADRGPCLCHRFQSRRHRCCTSSSVCAGRARRRQPPPRRRSSALRGRAAELVGAAPRLTRISVLHCRPRRRECRSRDSSPASITC